MRSSNKRILIYLPTPSHNAGGKIVAEALHLDKPKIAAVQFSSGKGQQGRVTLAIWGSPLVETFEAYRMARQLNEEHGTSLRVIKPHVADLILAGDGWLAFSGLRPFVTDGIVGYDKPTRKLGSQIVFEADGTRLVLPTGDYVGEKGIALAVLGIGTGDLTERRGELEISVEKSRLIAIEDFPSQSGGYVRDAKTTVPHGVMAERLKEAVRQLWRERDSAYIGPIIRDGSSMETRFSVFLSHHEARRYAVVAELPEKDAVRLE